MHIVVSTLTKAAGRNRDIIFLAFFLHKAKDNYESPLFPPWIFDIFPSADYVSIYYIGPLSSAYQTAQGAGQNDIAPSFPPPVQQNTSGT